MASKVMDALQAHGIAGPAEGVIASEVLARPAELPRVITHLGASTAPG
jgi:hypothetical protein